MSVNSVLYPNVTSIPKSNGISSTESLPKKQEGIPSEFDQVFDDVSQRDLSQIKTPLKFSAHATQRLRDRKISMDASTMAKVSDAVDKAESKGVEDTLVLTSNAALIVNVKNRTVITALDRGSLSGNVFTNIDGAVII